MDKKEIYFSNDVFKEVGEKHGINPKVVEEVFNSFLDSYKDQIVEDDGLVYEMPYMGEMMIHKTEASRKIDSYLKRSQRETNPKLKEKYKNIANNYIVRVKKISIEMEKMKRKRTFKNQYHRKKLLYKKFGMTSAENIKRKNLFMGHSLEEVAEMQNEYAYKYYKKNNLPVTL